MKKILLAVLLLTAAAHAQTIDYIENPNPIYNPERGFFLELQNMDEATGQYLTLASQYEDIDTAIADEISLVRFIVRLDNFKGGGAITSTYRDKLVADLNYLRSRNMKCILRFCYSNYYTIIAGQTYEPLMANMLSHIAYLSTTTQQHEDIISSMEAGFIGNFGEWYNSHPTSSSFGLGEPEDLENQPGQTFKNNRTTVANAIMGMTPNRMVAFRTPYFQKLLAPNLNLGKTYPKYSGSIYSRIAAHNDAFVNSLDDEGTFQLIWNGTAYVTTADRSYLATKSLTTFTGGESNDFNAAYATCDDGTLLNPLHMGAVDQLEAYHYNHLNYGVEASVIQHWVDNECYDEIKNRLGYRFVLRDLNINATTKKLTLRLWNNGFANVFNARNVFLVLRSSGGTLYRVPLEGPTDSGLGGLPAGTPTNIRAWYAGTQITLFKTLTNLTVNNQAIPTGNYDLYLEMPDAAANLTNSAYAIQCANADSYYVGGVLTSSPTVHFWADLPGLNNLFKNIHITSGALGRVTAEGIAGSTVDGLFDVSTFPNPFGSSFRLNMNTSGDEPVSVKIFDMLGKLVGDASIQHNELDNVEIGNDLAPGVYCIVVTQGMNEKKLRVIKR